MCDDDTKHPDDVRLPADAPLPSQVGRGPGANGGMAAIVAGHWARFSSGGDSPDGRNAERYRRILWAIASSMASKAVRGVSQAVIVGLAIQHLGASSYGLWVTAVSALGWLSWGQAGLAPGLTNVISAAEGKEQREDQAVHFTTAIVLVSAIAIVLLLIGQALLYWGGPVFIFPTDSAADVQGQRELWRQFLNVALVLAVLRLPLGLIESTFVGLQYVHLLRIFDMLGQVVCTVAAVLLVLGDSSNTVFLLGTGLAAEFGVLTAFVVLVTRVRPYLLPRPSHFDIRASSELFSLSGGYFVLQITGYLVSHGGALILAAYHSPKVVPIYTMTFLLYQMAAGLWMMVITGAWGAMGEAAARGDWPWVRHAQHRTILLTMVICGTFCLAIALGGNLLLRLWSGNRFSAEPAFFVIMAIYFCIHAWGNAHQLLLSAIGVVWQQLLPGVLNAILALGLAWLLIPRYGVVGLAGAQALAFGLTGFWMFPAQLRKFMKRHSGVG